MHAIGALTFSCCRSIISVQGDARCKQAPPRGGNPTVATTHHELPSPRNKFSSHEPSGADRRLTSFYRASTARETQCWQWNPRPQGQTESSQKYVSPPSESIPARASYIPPFRSTRDGRQPSFTAHRLQRRKKLDLDGGLPLKIHYTGFCRFVKQIRRKGQGSHFVTALSIF